MATLPQVRLTHMGLWVHDLDAMVDFYTRLYGFLVSDRGEARGSRIAFLTLDAGSHHQLVMQEGRPKEIAFNNLQQISFKCDSLAAVRAYHAALQSEPVTDVRGITHGNAWSVYFHDPEGNRSEVYCDTPWHIAQPFGVPIDLSLPEAEIVRLTEEIVHGKDTFLPMDEYKARTAAKLARGRA